MTNSDNHQNNRFIGESPAFLDALEQVSQVASLNRPILVVGERGTGKEQIASRIHFLSERWDQSYLQINCATLSDELIDSELFGHESGAFTGASKLHLGRFERANGGSLFLDELATISGRTQEKLLRVIEYGEFERLGGKQSIKTDVRIIAATNEDLPSLAEQGKFRDDLLDRLAFDVITLPPLRERLEDIPLLTTHFANNMTIEIGNEFFPGFTDAAMESLCQYQWPGNVRELKNTIERTVYRAGNDTSKIHKIFFDPFESPYRPRKINRTNVASLVDKSEVKPESQTVATQCAIKQLSLPIDLKMKVNEFECSLIQRALNENKHNQRKTAESLGLTYHQLRAHLKKHNDIGVRDISEDSE